jgi:hypothetical protein
MLATPPGSVMRVNPAARSSVHTTCRNYTRTCWVKCRPYHEGPPRSNCVVPVGKVARRVMRED